MQAASKARSGRIAKYIEIELQMKSSAFKTTNKALKDAFTDALKDLKELDKQSAGEEQRAKEIERLKEEVRRAEELGRKQKQAASDRDSLKKEVERLKTELTRTKSEKVGVIGDNEVKQMLKESEQEIEMNRKIIHEKATENDQLNEKIKSLEKERDDLKLELAVEVREVERLQTELSGKREEGNEKLIDDLKNQLNETLQENAGSNAASQRTEEERDSASAQIEELRSEFASKFEGIEKLLCELKEGWSQQANQLNNNASWARVAAQGNENGQRRLASAAASRPATQAKRFSACVSSKEKNALRSDVVIKKIKEISKDRSTHVKTVDNNRLYVNSAVESEIDEIVKGLEPMVHVEARRLVDRSPRIFVNFIDKNVDKEQYIENIINSNPEKQIQAEKIKFLYEINKMELDYKMAVFAVEPDYLETFKAFKRIKIGLTSCRIDEYRRAREYCFNCARPGHRASVNGQLVCTNEPACPICAGPHGRQSCTNSGVPKCANCIREGVEEHDALHPAFSDSCPTFKKIGKKRNRANRNV